MACSPPGPRALARPKPARQWQGPSRCQVLARAISLHGRSRLSDDPGCARVVRATAQGPRNTAERLHGGLIICLESGPRGCRKRSQPGGGGIREIRPPLRLVGRGLIGSHFTGRGHGRIQSRSRLTGRDLPVGSPRLRSGSLTQDHVTLVRGSQLASHARPWSRGPLASRYALSVGPPPAAPGSEAPASPMSVSRSEAPAASEAASCTRVRRAWMAQVTPPGMAGSLHRLRSAVVAAHC